MKTTVKTFWIFTLLMLTYSISGFAIDFTKVDGKLANDECKVSACLSSSTSNIDNTGAVSAYSKFVFSSDVELGNKPITEVYSSNQQRLRRVLEDNLFLRNIFLILSNHENLLVQGQAKLCYTDKASYVLTSDYYIFTLRRILI